MPVLLRVRFSGITQGQPIGLEMHAMKDPYTQEDASEWDVSPSRCLQDRIVVESQSLKAWSATFDYDNVQGVSFVPVIVRSSPGVSISQAARSLSTQVSINDGANLIFSLSDVSLLESNDVDWFCVGVFALKDSVWFFKEIHSFPEHAGDISKQLKELLISVQSELDAPGLDNSFISLPSPVTQVAPPLVCSPQKTLPTIDSQHAEFLASHHREVTALNGKLTAVENELKLHKMKTHIKTVSQAVGDSRPIISVTCENCERNQQEARAAKDRLIELEAASVLSELVGGQAADVLILTEENRALNLRCAELEGKCSVQTRLIEELNHTKKQLVNSITAMPKATSASEVVQMEVDGDDPIVHHIRIQERLVNSLRSQLDQLSTQISLATAMKN